MVGKGREARGSKVSAGRTVELWEKLEIFCAGFPIEFAYGKMTEKGCKWRSVTWWGRCYNHYKCQLVDMCPNDITMKMV